ncbi:MAG TPA: TIGR03435 family protein [Acidobacteriaceae bacterium]|nr:TIGR03435 family protein [Acidobacteriaceae bacterium]
MLTRAVIVFLTLSTVAAIAQTSSTPPVFDVASVKPSRRLAGPDYNNHLSYTPAGITARNATLKRLLAEAYHLQLAQILGPSWLDKNEYDIDARSAVAGTRAEHALMLRSLLAQRFQLTEHSDVREMRVYNLVISKSGPKIRSTNDEEGHSAGDGFHFHGDMRQFADLLAIQLSIPASDNPYEPARASVSPTPVLDKTGLQGIFDFSVDLRPELGTDMFASWQRVLDDQLGLKIVNSKGKVSVLVVDEAARIPTEN